MPLPSDDRIMLLRNGVGSGPARCRQLGIDAARGSVIALLDDDDEWHTTKLARQLEAVDSDGRCALDRVVTDVGAGSGYPATDLAAAAHQTGRVDHASTCFASPDLRFGGAALQTSTLCFPTDLAREVRWDAHAGAAHDEPSWLIRVQRTIPDLRVVQLPDVLSTYNVQDSSVLPRHVRPHRRATSSGDCNIWRSGVAARARRLSVHQSGQRGRVRAIVGRSATRGVVGGTARPARPLRAGVCGSQCGEDRRPFGGVGTSADDSGPGSTCTRGASRAALRSHLPHPRHARCRCCWASRTPPSSCAKPVRPYSGWCPWSRRSRCCSPSLTSASVPRC